MLASISAPPRRPRSYSSYTGKAQRMGMELRPENVRARVGQIWRCLQSHHRGDRLVVGEPRGGFVRMRILGGLSNRHTVRRGREVKVPLAELSGKYVLIKEAE